MKNAAGINIMKEIEGSIHELTPYKVPHALDGAAVFGINGVTENTQDTSLAVVWGATSEDHIRGYIGFVMGQLLHARSKKLSHSLAIVMFGTKNNPLEGNHNSSVVVAHAEIHRGETISWDNRIREHVLLGKRSTRTYGTSGHLVPVVRCVRYCIGNPILAANVRLC